MTCKWGLVLFLRIRKGNELVAEAPDGYQVAGFGRFFFDIPAQTHDEIVDGARVRILVQIPDVLKDRFSGNRMAGVLDQIAKQLRFHQSELKALISYLQRKVLKSNTLSPNRNVSCESSAPGLDLAVD